MTFSTRYFGAILCLLTFLLMTGCGGQIDWFPAYKRQPTTPDKFDFTPKTGVQLGAEVTSDPITVTGLTADSSPISITGTTGSNSKYSINGGTATDAPGTVKNGDQVTVTHTAATAVGLTTQSTLKIGDVSAIFSSTTVFVSLGSFTGRVAVGGNLFQTHATVTSVDTVVHVIKISDTRDSALYSVGTTSTINTFFKDQETFGLLNGAVIYVRKEPDTTTVLTIDGVEYPVVLPAQ